jgi:hypothetical protein
MTKGKSYILCYTFLYSLHQNKMALFSGITTTLDNAISLKTDDDTIWAIESFNHAVQ